MGRPSLTLAQAHPELRELFSSENALPFEELLLRDETLHLWHCPLCRVARPLRASAARAGRQCIQCSQRAAARAKALSSVRKHGSVGESATLSPYLLSEVDGALISLQSKKLYLWACSSSACANTREAAPRDFSSGSVLCLPCAKLKQTTDAHAKRLTRGTLSSVFPEIAAEFDLERNPRSAEDYTPFSAMKVWWICPRCSLSYASAVHNRTFGGTACPVCNRGSKLERLAADFLTELGLRFVSNGFPLRDSAGARYQLDLHVPSLNLAFEVQDFATHARASDTELMDEPWRSWATRRGLRPHKKGPTYHALKQRLCERADVALVELWEDDLRSGAFHGLMSEAISRAESEEL